MSDAKHDANRVATLLGVSSSDGTTPVSIYADPTTHRLLTQSTGSAAPVDATYVTLSTNATLTNERVLTGTANQITLTDNGAGSTIVLSLPQSIATTSTPTFASMTLTAASSLTLGTASSATGGLILRNATNANTLSINSGVTGTTYALTLPTDQGGASTFLQNDGAGVLSWVAAGGAGTVTDVSVVTANGVSGSVADSTTTPAITLTLGAITPSTVVASDATTPHFDTAAGSTNTGYFLVNGKTSGSLKITAADATAQAITLTVAAQTVGAATLTIPNMANVSKTVAWLESPSFTTPVLGVASATSINKVAITAPATSATLTISDGKTLAATQTITLTGTDSTVMTFPTTSATIARTDAANTFTGASTASAWVLTSPTITTKISPTSDDGAPLGDTTHNFSDLFLASGAVLNYANGNVAVTHTSGVLTMGTGDLRVTTAGSDATSVVTVGGTQTLTSKTLTSPTLTTPSAFTTGGTITLAENTSVALDPAGSADGKFTGITVTAVSGYSQAFGDLVYLDPTDSRWEATDANAASGADGDARGVLGMVVVAGTDGNACTVLLNGIVRADAKFPTFTINNPIYVSETAGLVTQTQPVTTDVVIRIVGAALTADEMYFNPDNTWTTHV